MKLLIFILILFFISPVIADEYDFSSDYQPDSITGKYDDNYTSPILDFQNSIDDMEFEKVIREERRRQEYTLRPYGRSNTHYNSRKKNE